MRVRQIVGSNKDPRMNLTSHFASNLSSQVDLHNVAQAMGVRIVHGSRRGGATYSGAPPFAFATGGPNQPSLEVTAALSPKQKFHIQLVNKRFGTVVVRGGQATLDTWIEELTLFLGPVVDLQSPAPPASSANLLREPAPKRSARQILADAEEAIQRGIGNLG
ncbi:unnamed protein product [Prorocentrum cordatum]|uniref:Uncharacterized protein n=1 Tax=Prorocentrum cordatum TaxID=2364126 RepID=A0ABN9PB90_9DINO|nr:unnamed protein product [Polarella glacialis]